MEESGAGESEDEMEERLKASYRAFYLRVGAGMAVAAAAGAVFLFSIQRVLATGELEPARSIAAGADGLLAFLLLISRRWVLAVICLGAAVATIAYLPTVSALASKMIRP